MNIIKLPDMTNVVANGTATLKIPKYLLTLCRLDLVLGGTAFTKANVASIRVKLGTRVVWSVETFNGVVGGTILDKRDKYSAKYDQSNTLVIDWTERDFMNVVAREIGGYDMAQLRDDIYLEVQISGATAPTLEVYGFFTPPQTTEPGKIDDNVLIQKFVSVPWSVQAGGRYNLNFDPRGALIKRVYFYFSGAQGGAGVDSNLYKVEIKKNGVVVFDPRESVARFVQQQFGKVPQANLYVMDFCFDNNSSGALSTADATSLEILQYFNGPDNGVAYFELLDIPGNV